jgi:hypothetical protein
MFKLTSVALCAALGAAGVGASLPVAACQVVDVVRPVAYVPVHYRPYYGHDRYGRPEYVRFDRFHHRWDGR